MNLKQNLDECGLENVELQQDVIENGFDDFEKLRAFKRKLLGYLVNHL